ncbi:MAG: carbon-nitrogen hydrolase family protein [Cyanobacteria bacterium SIG27]|nr:carbon-nitrogen hydrolase family protein [Cyanobacteria bacterium SIG27]
MTGILSIQFNPKIRDKEFNLKKIEDFIYQNSEKKLDLVLFPEFFSTGIDHNSFLNIPEDEAGGKTIAKVKELAKKFNTNIVAGSVIEKSKNKLYNTSFVINRTGETVAKYRKIHLFNYNGGTEGNRISAGKEPVVVELDFGKVGLNICYDFRYPTMQKNLVKMGAEILVCPTAWCILNGTNYDLSCSIWQAVNMARAYDNLVYTISCNQVGKVNERISNIGYSMIVSPDCEVLANAKNEECAIYAKIDLERVRQYKKEYPISCID